MFNDFGSEEGGELFTRLNMTRTVGLLAETADVLEMGYCYSVVANQP